MKRDVNCAVLLFVLVFPTVVGCGPTLQIRLPEPKPLDLLPSTFQVGAAKVDITPMPGYAMGGHGPGGTISRGYWLRLYARAVYMEDTHGQSLAFVSCDLWSMPGGLADRVAELVHKNKTLRHLGREQIILAATHTHQGPGNFSTAKAFNDFGSRLAGFDPRLFDFLAEQITCAIERAYDGRRSCMVFHRESEPIERLFRNRSVEAFALNLDSRDVTGPNHNLPIGNAPKKLRKLASYHAVDPRVATLRFGTPDRRDSHGNLLEAGDTIALLAFAAVHPEAMSAETQVYSSDLFGVAAITVEQRLKKRKPDVDEPVVAVFNGAEGDISADWNRQDRHDALSLGRKLADAIFPAEDPTKDEVRIAKDIRFRYAIQPIAGVKFTESPQDARRTAEPQIQRQTAKRPMPGVAFAGGAEDGRTTFHEIGFVEGVKGLRQTDWVSAPSSSSATSTGRIVRDQGSKHPILDLRVDLRGLLEDVSKLIIKPQDFPHDVPIGVYSIGEVAIVTAPAEFTTMMGKRVKQTIKEALQPSPEQVEFIGLANEYLLYVATPEEYEAQHYEGASTLYGPASGPYFLHLFNDLCNGSIPGTIPLRDRVRRYQPGPRRYFTLRDIGEPPYHPDDGLEQLLVDNKVVVFFGRWWASLVRGLAVPERNVVGCKWRDDFPSFRWSARVTPAVKIVEVDADDEHHPLRIDGILENDEGLRFVTIALNAGKASSEWVVFWLLTPKMRSDLRDRRLQFQIRGIDGNLKYSTVFTVGSVPTRKILKASSTAPHILPVPGLAPR